MGKQAVVAKTIDAPGLPVSGLYTVGATVLLTDAEFNDLPSYVVAHLTSIITVADPARGSAAPSALTTAQVPIWMADTTIGHAITAGTVGYAKVDRVLTGDAFWGVPGSALDLGMTLDVGGESVTYPDEPDGAVYDMQTRISGTSDPADAGKIVHVDFGSWAGLIGGGFVQAIVYSSGFLIAATTSVDATFKGDSGASFTLATVDCSDLTHDLNISASIAIMRRV